MLTSPVYIVVGLMSANMYCRRLDLVSAVSSYNNNLIYLFWNVTRQRLIPVITIEFLYSKKKKIKKILFQKSE